VGEEGNLGLSAIHSGAEQTFCMSVMGRALVPAQSFSRWIHERSLASGYETPGFSKSPSPRVTSLGGSMSEHKRQARTELTADQKAKRDESTLAATGRDAELELSAEELEERIAPVKAW
jgi:hypothetical protein